MSPLIIYVALFAVAYLIVLVLVQYRQVGKAQDLSGFFVAGRNIKLGTAIATLGATEIGLITIAYNAQKGFNSGFSAFHIGGAALVGALIVGLTGFIVKPLHKTGVLTLPEYYEQRYGKDIRVFGGIVMAAAGILNMGLFLKVASLFLMAMMPDVLGDISMPVVMITLIAIAVLYTCMGGMQSVIATDVMQFLLLVFALLAAALYYMNDIGLGLAFNVVEQAYGAGGFDPLVSASFGLDYVLWMVLVAGVVSCAVWPTALSRVLCIQDEHTTQRAYLYSALIYLGRMVVPAFLGIMAFTYFNTNGDMSSLELFGDDADLAATASFLSQTLPFWALAFMVVAMFASFMSTQDGYLFCWASILSRDVIGVLKGRVDDEAFQKRWTRILIVVIALYELYWGLIYEGSQDIWDYMAVTGSIYFCSGIVLLAGGLYWKGATRWGAWAALICGFSALLSLEGIKELVGLQVLSAAEMGFACVALSIAGFVLGSMAERRFAS